LAGNDLQNVAAGQMPGKEEDAEKSSEWAVDMC